MQVLVLDLNTCDSILLVTIVQKVAIKKDAAFKGEKTQKFFSTERSV
jgi:hypothetical protein